MGVVYRARHRQSRVFVALKTVHVPAEGQLQGIRREIAALARLNHPGVVRILEHGLKEGLPWYAMREIYVLVAQAHIARELGNPNDAMALGEQAVAIARALGQRRAEALAHSVMAIVHAEAGRFEQAEILFEQGLEIWQATGERRMEAKTLLNLASLKQDRGQWTDVCMLLERALTMFHEAGDRPNLVLPLNNLANLKADLGEPHEARRLYEQALSIATEIGDRKHQNAVRTDRAAHLGRDEELPHEVGDEEQLFFGKSGLLRVVAHQSISFSRSASGAATSSPVSRSNTVKPGAGSQPQNTALRPLSRRSTAANSAPVSSSTVAANFSASSGTDSRRL